MLILSMSIIMIPVFAQKKIQRKDFAFGLSTPLGNNLSFYDYNFKAARNKTCFFGIGGNLIYKRKSNMLSVGTGIVFGPASNPIFTEIISDSGTTYSTYAIFTDILYHKNIYKGIGIAAGVNFINYHYNLYDRANQKYLPG